MGDDEKEKGRLLLLPHAYLVIAGIIMEGRSVGCLQALI